MEETPELPQECVAWLAEVDRLMKRDWFIDSHDAGFSDGELLRYWRYGESPSDFVEWFAAKYDLITIGH